MRRESAELLDILAAFVHFGLALGHGLALVYNILKRNLFDSIIHALCLGYDASAAIKHARCKEIR